MDSLDQLLGIDPTKTITAAEKDQEAVVAEPVEGGSLVPHAEQSVAPVGDVIEVRPKTEEELEDDFQFARTNIKELITQTRQALDSAIVLAQSSDAPRAYEVVGKMLENIVNANRELVGLHKTKKDTSGEPHRKQSFLPTGEPQQTPGVNIEKAVFVGRTSDLLREIKALQKRAAEEETAAEEIADANKETDE